MRNQARRTPAQTGDMRQPRALGAPAAAEQQPLSASPQDVPMETMLPDSARIDKNTGGEQLLDRSQSPETQPWVCVGDDELTFLGETTTQRRIAAPAAVRRQPLNPYFSLAAPDRGSEPYGVRADDETGDCEGEDDVEEDSFVSSTSHGDGNCEDSDGTTDRLDHMRPLIRSGVVDVENAADSSTAGSFDEIGPARPMRSVPSVPESDFIDMELDTRNHRDLCSRLVSNAIVVFEYVLRDVTKLLRSPVYRQNMDQRSGGGGVAGRLRVTSPWLEAFGFQWRLLIFPRGNGDPEGKFMSVFLECSPLDSAREEQKKSWRSHARFQLALKNQTGVRPPIIRREMAGHMFSPRESDWGFQEFAPCAELESPRFGWLIHDQIIFRVWIEFDKDSYTFSEQYDSKRETGFVGLRNQGATCYMNSLLQTLYNIGAFRRAVYELPLPPLEGEAAEMVDRGLDSQAPASETSTGTPLTFALQRVFFDLQHEDQCVTTKELTNAFGWTDADAFTQHDAQELNRLLCDTLEERMKGTPLEGTIARLFQGQAKRFIKCVHVDFESSHDECFYDLSLNVKGCKDLYDSFRKYIEVETLEGDNKYYADGFGLQDAKMGVQFIKLPPVLQLHLKRFEYDFNRDMMVKINDRYEFYPEIKLGEFVDGSTGADDEEYIYVLHAVLVHMGDVHGGHYHAYIRPDPGTEEGSKIWFKFDDERVLRVTESEAVEDNFGAPLAANGVPFPPQRRFTNAYMLQYVRKKDAHIYLGASTEADVPEALRQRIALEKELEEKKIREREELRQMMNIRLITPAMQKGYHGLDWTDLNQGLILRVRRSMLLGEFKQMLLKEVLSPEGIDASSALSNENFDGDACQRMLVWTFVARINQTIRPSRLLNDGNHEEPLERAWNDRAIARNNQAGASPGSMGSSIHAVNLFIDVRQEPVRLAALFDKRECLMLFKWYESADPPARESPELRVLGWDVVPMHLTMQNLVALLRERNVLPRVPLSELYWYEEVTSQDAKEIVSDVALSTARNQLQSGDIIIFGRRSPIRQQTDQTARALNVNESGNNSEAPVSSAALLASILQDPDLSVEEQANALYRHMFWDARDFLRHRCDVRLVPLTLQRMSGAAGDEPLTEEPSRGGSVASGPGSDQQNASEILLRNVSTQLTQYGLGTLLVAKLRNLHQQQQGLDLMQTCGVTAEDLRPSRVRFHRRGFSSLDDFLYPRDSDPIPMSGARTRKILECIVSKQRIVKLFYEFIDTDAEAFEGKQEVTITWRPTPIDMIGRKILLALPLNATYGDLIRELESKLSVTERTALQSQYAGIRVHELWQKKIIAGIVPLDRTVTVLGPDSNRENFEILAEPVPPHETPEELSRQGCVLIRVAHISKSASPPLYGIQQDENYAAGGLATVNSFGLPFLLRVPSPEIHGTLPVQQLQTLIQERLQLPENEFRQWRLLYVRPAERHPVIYLQPNGHEESERSAALGSPENTEKAHHGEQPVNHSETTKSGRPSTEKISELAVSNGRQPSVAEGVTGAAVDTATMLSAEEKLLRRGLINLQDCIVENDDTYVHNFIGLEHHDSNATKRRATSRLRYLNDKPLKIA
ncbi:ubiquitin-specific protease [Cyanidioschyzon merolae strain 10D]|uniref:ubiquitinyl hydrolase 1 n=1 Tax=Cyanidioschyzon merolae (strain NIES-3377 / 10D) TaxID=280699 RepID=M1VBC0_CYAM1|nr:ubiquitin-specific protease [Cyanidioschyzon merolae strain 10D]BAM82574.1 ubiquitin-specific protease [Cyanidioschyzon merolae strain 10D]|eukprot:XP_005538610.1 ubiquitin-specific protease [Cyanidioschyzon merolae strain 10D]